MIRPPRYRRRRHGVAVAAVTVAVAAGVVLWAVQGGWMPGDTADAPAPRGASASTGPAPDAAPSTASVAPGPTAAAAPPAPGPAATSGPTPPGLDLAAHSTTAADSIWVVVNKQHPIDPLDYEPADLVSVDGALVRAVVQPDLEAMVVAAQADGVGLGLRTGFRSYGFQSSVRADVEARRGYAHAEKYSARPGYSEHQTGLSFDLHGTSQPGCDLQACFAGTAEGVWVAQHAAEYGFLVRYTPANTALTGFSPEAWHLRFVGRELAGWMADQGIGSLEEALGVSGGPDYPAG